MKNLTYKMMTLLMGMVTLSTTSCSDDFLEPDPLSFYEPEKTFSTVEGLEAGLAMCDRLLHNNFIYYQGRWNNVPIGCDYLFSDLMVFGQTDAGSNMEDDFVRRLTPTTQGAAYLWDEFWSDAYGGVKYANGIIANLPNVSMNEELKNAYLGRAYFHRANQYYQLIFHFGDIPLVTKLVTSPKEDYRSTRKEAIIEKMIEDLEFAVKYVPSQKNMTYYGMVNNEACKHLLIKYYLSAGRFADAENLATDLIENSGLALMREPFGTNVPSGEPQTWEVKRNVIWDLHRSENKIGSFNTECIMGMPNVSETSFVPYLALRIFGPFWNDGNLMTPDGYKSGVQRPSRSSKAYEPTLDWVRVMGRGIATYRPTYFAQHGLWMVNGVEDTVDLRHNREVGNWMNMEDIRYNNPKSAWHGKNLTLYAPEDCGDIKAGTLLCPDTIRSWFDYPLYKIYYLDVKQEANMNATNFEGASAAGATANLYLFRLAETYLLRAEAKLYQGKDATSDVNEVRKRAQCSQLYTSVNIGDIMNERARELYLEEFRNVELTRVSMILAMTGIPDEWGNTYDINTWDKQDGTDATGGSYWYQRIMHYSYYNKGAIVSNNPINYTMGKHNLFWPIPNKSIIGNKKAPLKQNYGYDGYDPNVKVWETWQEAVADEEAN